MQLHNFLAFYKKIKSFLKNKAKIHTCHGLLCENSRKWESEIRKSGYSCSPHFLKLDFEALFVATNVPGRSTFNRV